MEKAYDLKVLQDKLKAKGLDLAEEALKMAIIELLDWVAESAPLSATPYDDMALIVLPQIKKMALEQADKIDGEVG